jgi:hypothetical protein
MYPELDPATNYILWHVPDSFVLHESATAEEVVDLAGRLLDEEVPCTDLLLHAEDAQDLPGSQWCGPRLCALADRSCPLAAGSQEGLPLLPIQATSIRPV